MPERLGWRAWALGGLLVLAYAVWARGGMIWVWRKFRLLTPAPENLRQTISNISARMRIPVHGVWLLKSSGAQAYALPFTGDLAFSGRFLSICSEGEVTAVAAHELGHLSEPGLILAGRLMGAAAVWPWVFVVPFYHLLGLSAYLLLVLISSLVFFVWKALSREFEARADKVARENEANEGDFAQALVKLYEHNLLPAVLPAKRSTHPDLYDRLVAAGMQPDYPRPRPARLISVSGFLFSVLLGAMVGIRFAGEINNEPTPRKQAPRQHAAVAGISGVRSAFRFLAEAEPGCSCRCA